MSTPGVVRAWESHFAQYLTIWKSNVMGTFVQPLLYLLGMGLGVGSLVDRGGASGSLGGLTYFEFLAPGLLATTGMMVTANEATWPVLGGFKWWRSYHAQAATPLTPSSVAGGTALWHLTKATIAVVGVATALMLFDETRGVGLLVAVPFGALTGSAIAAPITAWASTREHERSFPTIHRFVVMPLFLFGGAFFPVSQLPDWMEPIAKVTPLWHGVQLCRDAVNDSLRLGDATGHVAVLLAYAVTGWVVAAITFTRRLHT